VDRAGALGGRRRAAASVAGHPGQADWTVASSGGRAGGSGPRARRARAAERSRGRGRLTPATGAHAAAPRADADQLVLVHRRHVVGLGRRDDRLAARAQQLGQQLAALGVELGHHVVEQHQRRAVAALGQQLALGEQEREQRGRCWPCEPYARSATPSSAARARRGAGRAR
jgi:hypothetical protein